MKTIVIAIMLLASPSLASASHYVNLICNVLAPAEDTVECGQSWPYLVPEHRQLCATDFVLVNKFPYDPPGYNTNMRTMYFATWGVSVPAHHPVINFRSPIVYPSGTVMRAWILNGMSEPQYVYGILSGYLSATGCDEGK